MINISEEVSLPQKHRETLEKIVRKRTSSQSLSKRAQIILLWDAGRGIRETGQELGIDRNTVRLWRKRWLHQIGTWDKSHQKCDDKIFQEKIREIFDDNPRSGAPPKFKEEEICQIIALACKSPSDAGLPISHWSSQSLQKQVLAEGIVQEISPRSVGRFLKRQTSSLI